MKKIFFFVVVLLVAPRLSAQLPNRTVNFTPVITGVPNYTALTSALTGTTNGTTIWMAAGTYKESEYTIPTGVIVIGGFPANATSIIQRIYPGVATPAQLSILDGNYTHRVATVHGTLDGFVITKGYVYDASSDQSQPLTGNGGGTLIDGGIVQNCILHDNVAAKLAPSSGTIPGTFVASVGDIYCTDGFLIVPTYSMSNGNYIATLPAGYSMSSSSIITPNGTKIPQGIVFYVDSSPTTGHFHIMGKVSANSIQPWTNPTFDVPGSSNVPDVTTATTDLNGRSETDSIIAYIQREYIAKNKSISYDGLNYAYAYNTPSGTATPKQWYLPAAGEINNIWKVHPQMDACARLIGWLTGSTSTMFPQGFYWSSSENSKDYVWGLNNYTTQSPVLSTVSKTQGGYTIPIASKTIITN